MCQESPNPPPQDLLKTDSPSILDPVHGTVTLKYRYRSTSTESDSDLYEFVTLSYGDPVKDPVSAALSARFAEDLDANRKIQGYYPLNSLDDTYRSAATQRLYTAYLEARPVGTGLAIRGGRQILDEFPESVPMDGGSLRYEVERHVALAVFGGIPVNPFESSTQGDAMYGAWAEWRPDPRARYQVEYLHLRDENLFGLHEDDLLGFSMDEGEGPFNVHARYTMLEGKSRDLLARLTGAVPDAGFLFDVQATYVFHRITALSYAIDPYASFLMDLQPYLDVRLRASKSFGDVFWIDASYTARRLVREGVETAYNHEFNRFEVTPRLTNWPMDGLSLSVSADFWNSPADRFWTVGGDVAWAVHRDVTLSGGSSYALYSLDSFTGEEHDRVRIYYGALRWKVTQGSFFEVRYTFEESVIDRFRIVEFGFRHAF